MSTPHPPVYRIQVGEDSERSLEQLSSSAPDTEFREDILTPLREAYTPGRGYADAFAQILRNLLRSYPFLVVSNYHPFVKSESRQLLLAEWNARQESEAKLRDRGEELSSAGFNPQVSVPPGATNLFVEGRLGRDRLLYDGQGAVLRRSRERMTEAEVRGLIEEETERVSPGALLRPVAEATAFPIVAHVVGSSEIAYLAQSQVLYSMHEVPAPVIVPRASMQLIEPKIRKVLDKFGIEPSRLDGDATQAINLVLRERAPTRLMESLAALREALADSFVEVQSAAEAADPGATSALESGRKSILGSVAALETKLLTRLKEKDQIAQQQLAKAAIHLSPGGQPQERVLSAYQYLMRYGEGFLDIIEANVITPLD